MNMQQFQEQVTAHNLESDADQPAPTPQEFRTEDGAFVWSRKTDSWFEMIRYREGEWMLLVNEKNQLIPTIEFASSLDEL